MSQDEPRAPSLSAVLPLPLTDTSPRLGPEDQANVYRVVLTGGPCAGKTTVQQVLTDLFLSRGWRVFRVPETATVLLGGGVIFADLNEEQAMMFQEHLLSTMLEIEETYFALARSFATQGHKTVVLCDRGAMDASAYIPRPAWLSILEKLKHQEVSLRDCRYDCVIHLVTAAKGAEEYYQLANNATRSEGLELACELDSKTSNAWVGHPYLSVIDNSTGFNQKIERVVDIVAKRLQLDAVAGAASTVKRKFVVASMPDAADFPVAFEDFDVEHHYIRSSDPNVQVRVRRRGTDGNWAYQATLRTKGKSNEKVETRRPLSEREYNLLLRQADPEHAPVIKRRRNFLYNHQAYQIDVYVSPHSGLLLLEAHLPAEDAKLPPFIVVEREVTDDQAMSMHTLSRRS